MGRATRNNALDAAAEGVRLLAKEAGAAIGLPKGTQAVMVLERALAAAWVADVAYFQGTGVNDTPERLNECIRDMTKRIAEEMRAQHYLRRGQKPN